MAISDHSYAALLMKKRRNVEQKETQNIQSGKKRSTEKCNMGAEDCARRDEIKPKRLCYRGRARLHPAKLPMCERKRPNFSVPKKNNKSKLLRMCLKGAKVHPTFAVQLRSVDLTILALKS